MSDMNNRWTYQRERLAWYHDSNHPQRAGIAHTHDVCEMLNWIDVLADAVRESRNATLDEVVRAVEGLDGIGIVVTGGIANVHEPTRDAILDRIERLRG